MLVAAALVPDTALLVPGAAGSADVLAGLRDAAERAVSDLPADARVVVVAPGPADRALTGRVTGSLAGAGVPDAALRWPVPVARLAPARAQGPARAGATVPASGTSVALHLLARAGRAPVGVLEVERDAADESRADRLRAWGRDLVADGPTALVVVGSLSARHGPQAPLADDPAAPAVDDALLAALAGDDPGAALDRLGAAGAARLAVSGWAPWQVLVGALDGAAPRGEVLAAQEPLGAAHAVLAWRPAARGGRPAAVGRAPGEAAR